MVDCFIVGCKTQKPLRQTNYYPYHKKISASFQVTKVLVAYTFMVQKTADHQKKIGINLIICSLFISRKKLYYVVTITQAQNVVKATSAFKLFQIRTSDMYKPRSPGKVLRAPAY